MEKIIFVPGEIVAGNNVTIPTNAPDIRSVVAAEITRIPSAVTIPADTSGTTEVAEINGSGNLAVGAGGSFQAADPVVAAVPTKVDATHITLDVDTELGDLLTLWYNAVGFLGPEP